MNKESKMVIYLVIAEKKKIWGGELCEKAIELEIPQ